MTVAKARIAKTMHTGLTVSDLEKSIAFFRDVLGFEVSDRIEAKGPFFEELVGVPGAEMVVAYVEAPGHTIELLQYVKPDERRKTDLRPCDTGFVHMAFEVEDLDAVVAAVTDAGLEPFSPPLTSPRKRRVVYTRDPDGHVLEFMQPAPAE